MFRVTATLCHLGVSVFLNIYTASVQLKGLLHIRTKLGKHNVMFLKFPWCSCKATRLENPGVVGSIPGF